MDLLEQPSEVIINSVGPEGTFGGVIAQAVIKKWGKEIGMLCFAVKGLKSCDSF